MGGMSDTLRGRVPRIASRGWSGRGTRRRRTGYSRTVFEAGGLSPRESEERGCWRRRRRRKRHPYASGVRRVRRVPSRLRHLATSRTSRTPSSPPSPPSPPPAPRLAAPSPAGSGRSPGLRQARARAPYPRRARRGVSPHRAVATRCDAQRHLQRRTPRAPSRPASPNPSPQSHAMGRGHQIAQALRRVHERPRRRSRRWAGLIDTSRSAGACPATTHGPPAEAPELAKRSELKGRVPVLIVHRAGWVPPSTRHAAAAASVVFRGGLYPDGRGAGPRILGAPSTARFVTYPPPSPACLHRPARCPGPRRRPRLLGSEGVGNARSATSASCSGVSRGARPPAASRAAVAGLCVLRRPQPRRGCG